MKLYDGHVISRVVALECHKEVTSLKLFDASKIYIGTAEE